MRTRVRTDNKTVLIMSRQLTETLRNNRRKEPDLRGENGSVSIVVNSWGLRQSTVDGYVIDGPVVPRKLLSRLNEKTSTEMVSP